MGSPSGADGVGDHTEVRDDVFFEGVQCLNLAVDCIRERFGGRLVKLWLDENHFYNLFFCLLGNGGDLLGTGAAACDFNRFLLEPVVGGKVGEGSVVNIKCAPLCRSELFPQLCVEGGEITLESGEICIDLFRRFGGSVLLEDRCDTRGLLEKDFR